MSSPNVIVLAEYRAEYEKALKEMRSRWGAGPWVGEPDIVEWDDPATGYPCKALRHEILGHWCGYVGVLPSHSCYGEHHDKVDAFAHGGLTFSTGSTKPKAIDEDAPWWFGFDCAHACDLIPFMETLPGKDLKADLDKQFARLWETMPPRRYSIRPDEYRTLEFVKSECASLAAQLRALD